MRPYNQFELVLCILTNEIESLNKSSNGYHTAARMRLDVFLKFQTVEEIKVSIQVYE